MRDEFQLKLENVWLEVDNALRAVRTHRDEVAARQLVVEQIRRQWEYSDQRYQLMLTDGRSSTLYLEDLLNVQMRLSDAEAALEQARSDYAVANLDFLRASGVLVNVCQ